MIYFQCSDLVSVIYFQRSDLASQSHYRGGLLVPDHAHPDAAAMAFLVF